MTNALLDRDGITIITDPARIIARWGEYFCELLNINAVTDDSILNEMPPFPQREELDRIPTMEEVKEATSKMKNGKAPGEDGITAEVYKHGGEQLMDEFHKLILLCWQQGTVPQGFKDVSIIPIFKNKGDHRDCNNYRGISLLAVAGKIMAKILQSRLAKLAEEVLTEA